MGNKLRRSAEEPAVGEMFIMMDRRGEDVLLRIGESRLAGQKDNRARPTRYWGRKNIQAAGTHGKPGKT